MPEFDEHGVLGLAFDSNYAANGRFFVYYSAPLRPRGPASYDHTSRVSEFRVSAQDPTEPTPHPSDSCCRWTSPGFDNNAGALLFGPDDGYLYISAGGGGADDVGLGHVDDWPQEGVL